MTMPPGWYRDPSQGEDRPALERWWDGSSWTERTRPPGGEPTAASPTATAPDHGWPAAAPPTPLVPPPPVPPRPGKRGGRVAMLIGGALVLAGLLVAVPLLLDEDGRDAGGVAGDAFERFAGPPGEGEERPEREGGSGAGDGFTEAQVGGAALPVPEGWEEGRMDGGVSVTIGGYPCPTDADLQCVDAGALLMAVPGVAGVTPEQLAAGDIPSNEQDSYGEAYGGITDSQDVLDEPVTVAGQQGHRVRTRVTTGAGTEAYVESVAFPAPDGSDALLLLRIGCDLGPEAPDPDVLDRFVQDVRAVAGGPGTEV
ncbi:DUF2510 domain-containing protein [Streptomyces millisiae]|uniref:DUF2510 domain-containing protein n=1 Tax=Streptomyces millisiae TaxID=3075542 RepID=A0ABU2M0F0_9ACTN|nr:DUF2510 domain-containing protein [Streptomyces sp. DSM 44918]MDT0322738.1 DUF2510 domain-containing protein [Streptomyces sp. DSM 44918]